jgi:ABC-type nitrate/sulfonate/bicarbonate transport system substrate-binding protein
MLPQKTTLTALVLVVAFVLGIQVCAAQKETSRATNSVLNVGIAPYQDMALLLNVAPLGLDKKHGFRLSLASTAWQDLTPIVASATPSVDVVFASLLQFITQEHSLNAASSDPVVFFYPAYVFTGGAFVTFNKDVPALSQADLADADKVKKFLTFRFAAQKTSSYEMLLSKLARQAGLTLKDIKLTDMGAEDGLLAADNGAVDVTSAGLTQKNEAIKRGGRVVLEMADMGQVDIAGFIAKRSTLQSKRQEIIAFLKAWPEAVAYTLSDIKNNSKHPLEYLRRRSSTRYTIEEFTRALSQEVLPMKLQDLENKVLAPGSQYDYRNVVDTAVAYYIETGQLKEPPQHIEMLEIN